MVVSIASRLATLRLDRQRAIRGREWSLVTSINHEIDRLTQDLASGLRAVRL